MKRFIYDWGSIWVQNETLACCFLSFYRTMVGGDLADENGAIVMDQAIVGKALTKMYDFIQTDWTCHLVNYLRKKLG